MALRPPKTPVVPERAPLRWLLAAVVVAPPLLCLVVGAEGGWIPALGTVGLLVPVVLLSARSIEASDQARLVAAGRVAQAHDRAYDALEARSDLLATASHELRTPLNGVIGMTELLLDTRLTTRQRRYAETARRSGEALLAIVDDLLELSRLEAGKLCPQSNEVNVGQLLDDVCGLCSKEARAKDLELTFAVAPGIPEVLSGDAGRIRQVLLNLVGNAVKFTDAGRVVVRADLVASRSDETVLRFEVRDTGIGFDPADLTRLFRPFEQARSTGGAVRGGAGLGLAISQQLVGLMGGRIEADSRPGHGSTFSFMVGLGPQRVEAHGPAPTPAPGAPASTKTRVLLVDDDPVGRAVGAELLTRRGFGVDVAADGREALAAAVRTSYAAIMLDWELPGGDGRVVAEELRRREPADAHTPIIALTAHASRADRDRCLAAGMDDYIAKPLRADVLDAVLARWVAPAEFDLERLLSLAPGAGPQEDQELLEELAELFAEEALGALRLLKDAVERGDVQALARAAHLLRGSSGTMGADRIASLCGELASAAAADDLAAAPALIAELEQAVARASGVVPLVQASGEAA